MHQLAIMPEKAFKATLYVYGFLQIILGTAVDRWLKIRHACCSFQIRELRGAGWSPVALAIPSRTSAPLEGMPSFYFTTRL